MCDLGSMEVIDQRRGEAVAIGQIVRRLLAHIRPAVHELVDQTDYAGADEEDGEVEHGSGSLPTRARSIGTRAGSLFAADVTVNCETAAVFTLGGIVGSDLGAISVRVRECPSRSPRRAAGALAGVSSCGILARAGGFAGIERGGHLCGPRLWEGSARDYSFDEARGLREVDRVTRSAQFSHAVAKGPSMSQRLCAGLNWPPLPICASEPVSISPEAVSRAGPGGAFFSATVAKLDDCAFGLCAAPCAWWSRVFGVGQPHNSTVRRELSLFPASLFPFCAGVPAIGVGQPARYEAAGRGMPLVPYRSAFVRVCRSERKSLPVGVGHPIEALADVRCAEARSAGIRRPNGVTQHFQRSRYNVEPSTSVSGRNLFSKDEFRAALVDEPEKLGEQVPGIRLPFVAASDAIERSSSDSVRHRAARVAQRASKVGAGAAEGRTGATCGPDWSIVGESGKSKGRAPDAEPGEEMVLPIPGKIIWSNIGDAPFVNVARSDEVVGDQLAQRGGAKRIDFVVVGPFTQPGARYGMGGHQAAILGCEDARTAQL